MNTLEHLIKDLGVESALNLTHLFKADVELRLDHIENYLKNGGDIEDLKRHVHSLKGLCRTYGATLGGDAAHDLQNACSQGDADVIRDKAQDALNIIKIDAKAAIRFVETFCETHKNTDEK